METIEFVVTVYNLFLNNNILWHGIYGNLPIIGVNTCLLPDSINWLAVTVLATVTNWFDKTVDLTWFGCTWRAIWLTRGLWDPTSWIACPP